jgi:hypothetical protein
MNQVYSLSFHQASLAPRWLFIFFQQSTDPNQLLTISPHWMKWGERCYLLDLKSVTSYWQQHQEYRNKETKEIFSILLKKTFAGPFLLVFALNPWKGALLLTYLQEQQDWGVHSSSAPNMQTLLDNMPIHYWFQQAEFLWRQHQSYYRAHFGDSYHFQKKFKRFLDRLSIKRFSQMKNVDHYSIKKRFGLLLGTLWKWSFEQLDQSEHDSALPKYFPWFPQPPQETFSIKKNLDYPLYYWEQIPPFLKEDLDRLNRQLENKEILVTQIDWSVTFANNKVKQLHIHFRHPCDLKQQEPHYTPVIKQLGFAFEAYQAQSQQQIDDYEITGDIAIISWKLDISHYLQITPQPQSLFDHHKEQQDYLSRIQALENQLPVAIEHFKLNHSYLWFESFALNLEYHKQSEIHQDNKRWSANGLSRPLFIYTRPQMIQLKPNPYRPHYFLNRLCHNWWQNGENLTYEKDFFLIKQDSAFLWASPLKQSFQWMLYGPFS